MTTAGTSFFSAVLDANVLYPAPLRDFFMWQAASGIFAATEHWESLRNPPKSREEYLASLARCGLVETSRVLEELL